MKKINKYFKKINKEFRSKKYNSAPIVITSLSDSQFVLAGLLFIVFVLIICFFIKKYFVKYKLLIKNFENVGGIIRQAIEKNVRFDIMAMDKKLSIDVHGLCIEIKKDDLIIKAQAICPELKHGENYKLFFFLIRGEKHEFFEFTSKMIRISQADDKSFLLHFEVPAQLINGQKREFLRIKPNAYAIQILMFWLADENTELPKTLSSLSKPKFAKTKTLNQINLEDISANGARITLVEESKDDLFQLLQANNVYFAVSFKLFDDPQLFILLSSQVKRVGQGQQINNIELGLHFSNYAVIKDIHQSLVWQKCPYNGEVMPLTNWISRFDILTSQALKQHNA